MKKIFFIILLCIALVFTACSKNETKPADSITEQEQSEMTEDTGEEGNLALDKEFGSDSIGYVSVPSDWLIVPSDEEGDVQMQAYSPDLENTITLDVFDLNYGEYTGEQIATALWNGMEEDGVYDMEGARVTLAGKEAYQLYGFYDYDDLAYGIIVWILPDDERQVVRYLCAEGPVDKINGVSVVETFNMVDQTYRTK